MQFTEHSINEIKAGRKTQTRRVAKPTEICVTENNGWLYEYDHDDFSVPDAEHITRVEIGEVGMLGRLKWEVGRTYAICPGRGKPSVGRIRLTGIRRERLHQIDDEAAIAEGVNPHNAEVLGYTPRAAFEEVWKEINGAKSWNDNPPVWVLTFEYVESEAD